MEQHILIIEDDKALNDGIAFALEKEGYIVHSAHSLSEAEKSLTRKCPNILKRFLESATNGKDKKKGHCCEGWRVSCCNGFKKRKKKTIYGWAV